MLIILIILIICVFYFIINYSTIKEKKNTIKSNKKLCVMISGLLRDGYEECLITQKEYIYDNYDSDIFVCLSGLNDIKKQKIKEIFGDRLKFIIQDETEPKSINDVEKNLYPMYHKIKRCFDEMENYRIQNNIYYDIYFKARPDIYIKKVEIMDKVEKNKIYIPLQTKYDLVQINHFINKKEFSFLPYDILVYSDYDVMKKFCYIIDYIYNSDNKCKLSEYNYKNYFIKNNIEMIYKFNYKYILYHYRLELSNIIYIIKTIFIDKSNLYRQKIKYC
jgi:hypothetical protein